MAQASQTDAGWAHRATKRKESPLTLRAKDRQVQKFLQRQLSAPAMQFDQISDPRATRGRRWRIQDLLRAAFMGMVAGCATLRDVEALTEEMGETGCLVPTISPRIVLRKFPASERGITATSRVPWLA